MSRHLGWRWLVAGVVGGLGVAGPVQAQEEGATTYSLERAINTALGNSHDLLAAERGLAIAEQQVREAWGSVLPDVSANASYSRNLRVQEAFLPAFIFDPTASPDEVVPVRFGSDNTWQAGLNFNQPLFEYTAFVGVGAAGRFRSLQNEVVRGTTQEVVTAVRRAYLDVLLAVEEHRLIESSVERLRQTLLETQAMNRAGLTSDYDVLRFEVQLANLAPNLQRAANVVAERKRTLLIEMGMDLERAIEVEGSLSELQADDVAANSDPNLRLLAVVGPPLRDSLDLEALQRLAVRRRSQVRQQELTIDLESTRVAVLKAEYFPTLSLFTNYNVTAQENGSPDFFGSANNRTTSAVTGVSVSFPLFRGFSRDARVQQARATVQQEEARLQRLTKEIESELRTVIAEMDEARLRVASQRRAVAQAARGFEIASVEYREGVGSQLQVTDAENALRQSEFNYAQAVYDYLVARVRLDAAAGTVPEAAGELLARLGDPDR